ncbi:hypothetical protein BT96DRAFT_1005830 [Gymnopus androsaceus JB14]|uniref:Uncharacterized protein n=1 Tax=Gymnopus androsaceus JB14 TaxID=1447944 RepID=A0A6A4GLP9_9AGAR|nr:hypothetical protein BT96DRAFT_1005830 [Gymnopus androsaceus JB14]
MSQNPEDALRNPQTAASSLLSAGYELSLLLLQIPNATRLTEFEPCDMCRENAMEVHRYFACKPSTYTDSRRAVPVPRLAALLIMFSLFLICDIRSAIHGYEHVVATNNKMLKFAKLFGF